MRISFLLTLLGLCTLTLPAQQYSVSDNGSAVKFAIKNFGVTVDGSFKNLKGTISFNPANLSTAAISATVDATTVNTGNNTRDNHLRKEDYFDVAKFPQISLVSTKVTAASSAGNYVLEGKITIKGVTKPISFPFTATARGGDFFLEGTFKLNRRDFGVGGGSMIMSDNLTVSLSVLAKKS